MFSGSGANSNPAPSHETKNDCKTDAVVVGSRGMGRGFAIAFLLACAAVPARAGLGVFANGVELSKDPSWSGRDDVRYDPDQDVFVVSHRIDSWTGEGIDSLTLSGTNLADEVSFVMRGNSVGVIVENLRLRTTATNRSPFKIDVPVYARLILSGDNWFEAAPGAAGLELCPYSILVITNAPNAENSSLVAIGGDGGAGIGSGNEPDGTPNAESLTIGGGVIEARAGRNACGIGNGIGYCAGR